MVLMLLKWMVFSMFTLEKTMLLVFYMLTLEKTMLLVSISRHPL